MVPPPHFLACAACGCHARGHEIECPHCGARLRRADGSIPRTAAALLLGLTAVAVPVSTAGGCGSDVESQGHGGQGGAGGQGDISSAAAYGVVSSVSASSGGTGGVGGTSSSGAAAYGVPQTDADMDGYIDVQVGGDDCNDMDKDIHPDALEKPGDGKDSNCDGNDDT